MLEETLANYAGTVILVSHDRDFLDRAVTSVLAPDRDGRWIEYAGGYSDMLAQRGTELDQTMPSAKDNVASREKIAQSYTPAKSTQKTKMSFKDKHALETLPGEIAKLDAQVKVLQRELEDPSLYTRDRPKFDRTTEKLGLTQKAIADAEERWLELEMLRSEIEGA